MNIDLGNIIIKKVVDRENDDAPYFILFETGRLITPMVILEQWQLERLAEHLDT